jgi:transcriptional regulator with XRE-family HTH domain
MISTDHQLSVAKDRLSKFRHNVEVLRARSEIDQLAGLQLKAAFASVEDLEEEIREYAALSSGSIRDFAVETVDDLPAVLIKARIARKLSQSDLAELLGVKPQQVQRWESQSYENAAFTRLAQIAKILGVRLPKRVELMGDEAPVPLSKLKRLLIRLGLPQEVVEARILPRGVDAVFDARKFDEVDARLETMFGWRASALVAGGAAFPTSQLAFKLPASAAQDRTRAYAAYVAALCRIVGSAMPKAEPFSTSWETTNKAMFDDQDVSLEAALQACWKRNIAVLPLQDAVAFHGAYWSEGGRTVIVLKPSSEEESRWLLTLLHEVFHHAATPSAEGLAILSLDETSPDRRESVEEQRAHRYAAEVVTGGQFANLTEKIVKDARGFGPALKAAAIKVANAARLPVGILANLLAWRLQEGGNNWWGVAAGLQEGRDRGREITRSVFVQHFRFDALPRMERDLLTQALEG